MRIQESINETFRASLKETHGKESWEKLVYLKEAVSDDDLIKMFMHWLDEREAVECLDDFAHQIGVTGGPFGDEEEDED